MLCQGVGQCSVLWEGVAPSRLNSRVYEYFSAAWVRSQGTHAQLVFAVFTPNGSKIRNFKTDIF